MEAISERLRQAGVAAKDIVVFDRLSEDLESAGFRISDRPGRARVAGNDAFGYEEDLAVYGSAGSLLSKAVTRVCDGIINLPVLKDHGIAGVTMALKKLFGAIHNPNKYHTSAGDPYVADVYMLPPIRKKVRLAICDAMTAQYRRRPLVHAAMVVALQRTPGRPRSRWPSTTPAGGSSKPSAPKRACKPLGPPRPTYIATAAGHGIGTNDPRRIERVEV